MNHQQSWEMVLNGNIRLARRSTKGERCYGQSRERHLKNTERGQGEDSSLFGLVEEAVGKQQGNQES